MEDDINLLPFLQRARRRTAFRDATTALYNVAMAFDDLRAVVERFTEEICEVYREHRRYLRRLPYRAFRELHDPLNRWM